MKKILGLDLGSASIGWAVIMEGEDSKIEAIGSRIVPLSVDDANEFTQGNTISKNALCTQRHTQSKGYDRYQQRRENLTEFLCRYNMLPDKPLIGIDRLQLWGLRAKAVSEKLLLPQTGRVLYHISQKRGYKATKADYAADGDKKQGEYVKSVINRYTEIACDGITVGQLFFKGLSEKSDYRIKDRIFPRRAYEEEFDKIIAQQKIHYPQIFTDQNIDILRNRIIFYQRGLKSCKHNVSICDFEKKEYLRENGKMVVYGPKVAPKSSPLAQVCKIWESVNNITLRNRAGDELYITPEQRRAMFEHLDNNDKLTLTDMYRILGIRKTDGWWGGKAIGKGLQGNTTKQAIRKALAGANEALLCFNLSGKDANLVNTETGEIIQILSENFLTEPLYRLWHVVYSIKEKEELTKVLKKQFGIVDPAIVDNLYAIDFVKQGYTNKSAKAMRRILPYLISGQKYSDACAKAGFNHSGSLTGEENQNRELQPRLSLIQKNELRQPIVEKILNQMINVVNALMEKYGRFDEIRVELARELKQSKDERNQTFNAIKKAEKENKAIAERIAKEYNLAATRSRIQKYKMWEESGHICFYCGQPVGVGEFLKGFDVEVEHIIPRSLFFDDSFSNKVCSCRNCNKEKNNRTAWDYMKSKPDEMFDNYLDRIEKLYKDKKINKIKYERLLTAADKIPTDFIDRQLRESQYIARKSREILSSICRNVYATSGSVTDFIRNAWGWNKVLENLNFERYKAAGLTETETRMHNGCVWTEEVIKGWNKRLDHRHHAIDALVIACTKQGYIQRMNNMSELKDISFKPASQQGDKYRERFTNLQKYIQSESHFTVAEVEKAASSILISFKAGKKVAVTGKRYIHKGGKRLLMQDNVVVPRGPLHEESLYGAIDRYAKNRKGETITEKQFVLKYPLQSITLKDIDSIVDKAMQKLIRQRFDRYAGNEKEVWKDMENYPLLYNGKPVRSVRCFTGLKPESVVALDRGWVKPGNNHHIAIYACEDGRLEERCVTFWRAVERRKSGVPVIITDPAAVWDNLPEGMSEEFMEQLPLPRMTFVTSFQQNEMYILGLEPEAFEEAMRNRDQALLGKFLYRVQRISSKDYWFRLHVETVIDETAQGKNARKFHRFKSIKGFFEAHPQKVKISVLGEITKI